MTETFAGKNVVILGLARQGTALARFFLGQGAQVTISDVASADQLSAPLAELEGADVRLVLGGHPLSLLDGCELLCLSGGVPPQIPLVAAARRQGISLSNDAILTIQRSPAPAIGITGSSGKTTTTTLVGLMLEAGKTMNDELGMMNVEDSANSSLITHHSSFRVWVGGNIGVPLVDKLEQIRPDDWLVLELSSFQLELFDDASGGRSVSPQIAAILNITPNHLDRHPSMAHYAACKANIVRWQGERPQGVADGGKAWRMAGGAGPEDVAVLGADDAITGRWLRERRVEVEAGAGQEARSFPLAARPLGFGLGEPVGEGCWLDGDQVVLRLAGRERPVVRVDEILLRGRHNVLNVAAACAISAAAGAEPEAMAHVARTFRGVAHRLELVREVKGVRWYNDSIATAPERAAAALRSFDEPIVLLAGGRDKKLPWDEFAVLAHQRVKTLIVFGEAADLIANAVMARQLRADRAEQEARSGDRPEQEARRLRTDRPERGAGSGLQLIRSADLAQAVAAAAQVAQPGDVVLLSPGGTSFDAYKDFVARGEHFRSLVEALPA